MGPDILYEVYIFFTDNPYLNEHEVSYFGKCYVLLWFMNS